MKSVRDRAHHCAEEYCSLKTFGSMIQRNDAKSGYFFGYLQGHKESAAIQVTQPVAGTTEAASVEKPETAGPGHPLASGHKNEAAAHDEYNELIAPKLTEFLKSAPTADYTCTCGDIFKTRDGLADHRDMVHGETAPAATQVDASGFSTAERVALGRFAPGSDQFKMLAADVEKALRQERQDAIRDCISCCGGLANTTAVSKLRELLGAQTRPVRYGRCKSALIRLLAEYKRAYAQLYPFGQLEKEPAVLETRAALFSDESKKND